MSITWATTEEYSVVQMGDELILGGGDSEWRN